MVSVSRSILRQLGLFESQVTQLAHNDFNVIAIKQMLFVVVMCCCSHFDMDACRRHTRYQMLEINEFHGALDSHYCLFAR